MTMDKKDFYEILGLGRKATPEEIKRAYRKKARELHPDVSDHPEAAARFEELQEAYDVLSDPKKREQYDTFGHTGVAGVAGQAQGPRPTWNPSWGGGSPGVEFDEDDLGSVFDAFFGGARGPGRATRARPRPRRGANVRIDLEVDLADIANGATRKIKVKSSGAGRTIEVSIPPGIAHGKTLRVAGEGSPSPSGPSGNPGDLLVTIRVRPHPLFHRGKPEHPDDASLDLFFDLPLSVAEAVRGASVDVPTLEGRVGLTVPEGTGSGRVLRLRGRGLGGPSGAKGDLYAVTQIVVPKTTDLPADLAERLDEISAAGPEPREGPQWS
jgi:curved DNA-binding protein